MLAALARLQPLTRVIPKLPTDKYGCPQFHVSQGRCSDIAHQTQRTTVFPYLFSLFLSPKYSDMLITCKGNEFKAHRAIVCPQSSFFDAALSGGFKVGAISLPSPTKT